jgi:hypothetical protein
MKRAGNQGVLRDMGRKYMGTPDSLAFRGRRTVTRILPHPATAEKAGALEHSQNLLLQIPF